VLSISDNGKYQRTQKSFITKTITGYSRSTVIKNTIYTYKYLKNTEICIAKIIEETIITDNIIMSKT